MELITPSRERSRELNNMKYGTDKGFRLDVVKVLNELNRDNVYYFTHFVTHLMI